MSKASDYNEREIREGRVRATDLLDVWNLVAESPIDAMDITEAVACYQRRHQLDDDGLLGPKTRAHIRGIDEPGPVEFKIPHGYDEIREVYGDPQEKPACADPAKYIVARTWESASCRTISADLIVGYSRRIYMHKLVPPRFLEAMRLANDACPSYRFRSIGCFNPRPKRKKIGNPPSLHTWAIAFDINPDTNRWAPADAVPFGSGWSEWSDLPEAVVEAFESQGFQWGGRWAGPKDTMHFQLAAGA